MSYCLFNFLHMKVFRLILLINFPGVKYSIHKLFLISIAEY